MKQVPSWILNRGPINVRPTGNGRIHRTPANDSRLAQAIVDTIDTVYLVLDKHLHVVAASPSYCRMFQTDARDVEGRSLYALGNGQWNIAEHLEPLINLANQHVNPDACEIAQDFPDIGHRTMLLKARRMVDEFGSDDSILLIIEDITAWRIRERGLQKKLEQREILLDEMRHRVANTLQIIASILMMKARAVRSDEARTHLQNAHARIMAAAAMQRNLQTADIGSGIELSPYLTQLCETLAATVIDDSLGISLKVEAAASMVSASEAISIGLIVTELVINALKHAFDKDTANGRIVVAYEVAENSWRLSVSDDGIRKSNFNPDTAALGHGNSIVKALANQIDGHVEIKFGPSGTSVSITPRSTRNAAR